MSIKESLSHKHYLPSLAGAILIYFAAVRIVQDFLYRGFSRPENLFESLGPLFSRPEPLEMPLYLLGIVVIPFLAALLVRLSPFLFPLPARLAGGFKEQRKRGVLVAIAGLAVVLVAITLSQLNFHFYLDYIADKGLGKAVWLLLTKRLFAARLIFFLSAAVLVWAYFRGTRLSLSPPYIRERGEREICGRWEWLFIVLLAFLVFHPNLPTQDHHYVYFIGPVNDHLSGKPMLYETSHLYGLLHVYFLAFIFKFVLPFSYASFSLILFIFYFGFFASLYYFLKRWLKSPLLAVTCVMVLVAVMYFFNTSPTRSVYIGPATTPFRFWMYLPILFLLLSHGQNPTRGKRELTLALSATAMFWNFDSGSFIAAAVVLALWYYEKFRFSKLVSLGLRLLGYVAAVFAAITFINFVIYGQWPNWFLFVKEFHQFRQGIGMTPLPIVGVFEIFLIVYLGTALWLLRQYFEQNQLNLVLFFSAVHGIFSLLYYIGESSWQNLTIVSFPAFLIGVYLFQNFFENKFARAAFCAVLVYAGLFLAVKLPVEFQNRDYTKLQSLRPEADFQDQNLYADTLELKERYPELSRIPLFHLGDTRILPLIGKPNFFDFYYLFTLYYREDVEREVKRLKKEKPKYLFVGRERDDRIDYFMSLLPPNYQKTRSLLTLDVYESR